MFFKYAVEKYYYTKNIGDKLLAHDLNQAVIYDLLERKLRLEFYQAEQIISIKLSPTMFLRWSMLYTWNE